MSSSDVYTDSFFPPFSAVIFQVGFMPASVLTTPSVNYYDTLYNRPGDMSKLFFSIRFNIFFLIPTFTTLSAVLVGECGTTI